MVCGCTVCSGGIDLEREVRVVSGSERPRGDITRIIRARTWGVLLTNMRGRVKCSFVCVC